jgi:hypothetical protein
MATVAITTNTLFDRRSASIRIQPGALIFAVVIFVVGATSVYDGYLVIRAEGCNRCAAELATPKAMSDDLALLVCNA